MDEPRSVTAAGPACVRSALGRLALGLGVLGIAACAVREPRPEAAWLDERRAFFETREDWNVSGRLGLSDGERGGSLTIRWQTRGAHHRVLLSTLTGGRRWLLEFGPDGARLTDTSEGERAASRPEPLVEAALGWPIPVSLMVDWMRGLPAPHGADLAFAPDGTLASLDHEVWSLTYDAWRDQAGILLPDRLTATSGRYRVRVVLGTWSFE